MNIVQPIRDTEKIEKMKEYLKGKRKRDYMLFFMGIAIGLRISDLLQLKKEDVLRNYIDITEKKTGNHKRVKIPPFIKKELHGYANELQEGEYLFRSRQGGNRPIDRSTAYRILREAASQFNVIEIGTHTLRKTFGYHFYLQTKDLATLQALFTHSDPKTTLIYIGIDQDRLDKAMDKYRI